MFRGISHSVVCRKPALDNIEPCIPFACFHIQYISSTYCGKRFPTVWESIPSYCGNTFPQYMGQLKPISIFKQKPLFYLNSRALFPDNNKVSRKKKEKMNGFWLWEFLKWKSRGGIREKSHILFAISNKMSIFAHIKLQKTMRTMLVNTYWWWRPLQLRQS